MNTGARYPVEVRERAIRMAFEHQDEYSSQWAAIRSIAEKFKRPDSHNRVSIEPGAVHIGTWGRLKD